MFFSTRVFRVFVMVLALALAILACEVPDSWIEAVRHLPTLTPTPSPLTLFVAGGGNDMHDCLSLATACQSVGAALGKATPGSTINIGAGEFRWYGPLLPLHDVTFQGAGVGLTTLTSRSSDVIQLVHPARVSIRGLTIAGDAGARVGNGIEVRAGATLNLNNARIHAKHWAVRVFTGASGLIHNATLDENDYALQINGNLTVSGSTIRDNLSGADVVGVLTTDGTTFDGNGDLSATSSAATPSITVERGGSLTMTGGSVSNNRAWGIMNNAGTLSLTGVTVSGNVWTGIWQTAGSATLDGVLVQNNQSYGVEIGGRSGVDPGTLTISRSAITGNHSAGLRIDDGVIRVQNTTIGDTVGTSSGDGIWGYGGNLTLLDSTVAYNGGHGIELGTGELTAGTVTIQRSVIALNTGTECAIDSRVTVTSAVSPYVCSETWTRATLKLRPLVTDGGTSVHPIDATSPLVDAGGPAASCPPVDQRGAPRPAGVTCDVGAYEYGSAAAALVIATPDPDELKDTATPGIIQILPSETPTATATLPSAPQVTFIKNGNCRKGPGTGYNIVTSLAQGQQAPADGRDEQSQWVDILVPNTQAHCWVSLSTVELNVPVETLEVLPLPPIPDAPASLSRKAECVGKLKKLTVKLIWTDVSSETGYHVYRNGTLIGTAGANVTTYMDGGAPLGVDLTYEVEAFNANGSSSRAQTTVSACK